MADMKAANAAASSIVQREASSTTAPIRKGRLRASIKPARQVGRARVYSNLVYAPVIHYGWPAHNIKGNLFLNRAADDTEDRWLEAYRTDLQAIVNQVEGA
jgi:hypothetical protein